MLCLCAAQLKFWFQTDLGRENSASYYRQGRQLLLPLLTMVKRWSRSTSNFYVLMRKIMQHLESCLLWQLKLTEFCVNLWCFWLSFSTGSTKWNLAAIRSLPLFMASLFIGFLVEKYVTSLVKVGNPISDGFVFVFHLAWCVKRVSLRMVSLSNYCSWCLFLYLI